jgi:hypothetical protein
MAVVRRKLVVWEEGKWSWRVDGNLWEFRLDLEGRRGLWRNGTTLSHAVRDTPLLCTDDAVIYSIGFEYGLVCDEPEGGDAA